MHFVFAFFGFGSDFIAFAFTFLGGFTAFAFVSDCSFFLGMSQIFFFAPVEFSFSTNIVADLLLELDEDDDDEDEAEFALELDEDDDDVDPPELILSFADDDGFSTTGGFGSSAAFSALLDDEALYL